MARQSRAPVILLTRPLAQSLRFAEEAAAVLAGLQVVISPLMAPDYVTPDLPDLAFKALVLTSETGVEAARRISAAGHALPDVAFCVGDRTAAEARAAGFRAISAKGDAGDLIRLIQSRGIGGPLLHLRGEDSRGDVAETLTKGGIETFSATSYRQLPCPLTAQAVNVLRAEAPVIVPLFSPRSARLFIEALPALPLPPFWIAAISQPSADEASRLDPERLEIAARPDALSMRDAIARLLAAGRGS